jgi:hypothetical protein
VNGLLSEYREIESVSLRIGVPHAGEIAGMIEHIARETDRIENRLIGPSEAVASALSCVMALRRISDDLAHSTVVYDSVATA